MKVKMYSVFDAKSAAYGYPWYDLADDSAIRNFADNVNDQNPKNMWFNHSEDFSLFYLGEFDTLTASIKTVTPLCLVTASALRSLVKSNSAPLDFHDKNGNQPIVVN